MRRALWWLLIAFVMVLLALLPRLSATVVDGRFYILNKSSGQLWLLSGTALVKLEPYVISRPAYLRLDKPAVRLSNEHMIFSGAVVNMSAGTLASNVKIEVRIYYKGKLVRTEQMMCHILVPPQGSRNILERRKVQALPSPVELKADIVSAESH